MFTLGGGFQRIAQGIKKREEESMKEMLFAHSFSAVGPKSVLPDGKGQKLTSFGPKSYPTLYVINPKKEL